MLLTRQLRTQVTLILTTQAVMDYKDRRVSGNYEVLTPKSEAVYKQHFNLIGFFFLCCSVYGSNALFSFFW